MSSERALRLTDDRRRAYVRWNERGRHPVLFCHGTPGSRLFRPPEQTLLTAIDVDFVTVGRPGYGHSTPKPGRTLLDWPEDVATLADDLGWRSFAVAGISGGGPHALACGYAMADRVTIVGVVSGLAPFWPGTLRGMLPTTRQGFWLARWAPWLLMLAVRRMRSSPERFLAQLRRELPDSDRQIIDRPEVAATLSENYAEAVATDEAGREMVLLRRPWGFDLSQVRVPVKIWHGEVDRNVPVAHAHRLAAELRHCQTTLIPGGGHYVVFDRWETILSGLIARQ
jgi:pimeloyl-ACP methyl ester carboxylesterase